MAVWQGYRYCGNMGGIQRTNDDTTWNYVYQWANRRIFMLKALADGYLYAITMDNALGDFRLIRSNDGFTWTECYAAGSNIIRDIILSDDGTYYLAGVGNVYAGTTPFGWVSVYAPASPYYFYSLQQFSVDEQIYAGEYHDIHVSGLTMAVGQTETCANPIYIGNKSNKANITHVEIEDGGSFTALAHLDETTTSVDLLPTIPAQNDAVYFGCDTTVNDSGPFCSLVFNLNPGYFDTSTPTLTWQYWNGAAWTALDVTDNTNGLQNIGVNSVHWVQPSDWAAYAIDPAGAPVTGYWVRLLVDYAATANATPPQQNTTNIYSITWPCVDVDNVHGILPALTEAVVTIKSDRDGVGSLAPDLYANRLLCGLRSYDRGPTFNAYLNASLYQLPLGVAVVMGSNTTPVADPRSVTGYRCVFNPTAASVMSTRVTWWLSADVARDYYGTFHAFLRGQQYNGLVGATSVRLVTTTGSGGLSWTSETKTFTTVNEYQLIDFGRVTLPVSGSFMWNEVSDRTTLAIQASSTSGTPRPLHS